MVYGRLELTPAAIKAGKNLAGRLFNNSNEITNYKFCPTTVFTPLEYGAVGYAEEDAITTFGKDNIECYITEFSPLEWVFSMEKAEDSAFCKLICLKNENNKIVGLHYLGPNAADVT